MTNEDKNTMNENQPQKITRKIGSTVYFSLFFCNIALSVEKFS